jgi:hypothetical protein
MWSLNLGCRIKIDIFVAVGAILFGPKMFNLAKNAPDTCQILSCILT